MEYVLDVNVNGQRMEYGVVDVSPEMFMMLLNQGKIKEMRIKCPFCPQEYEVHQMLLLDTHVNNIHKDILNQATVVANKMPEGQGKRDIERHHYEYIPLEFLDEIASIFEEGRRPRPGMPEGYGDYWMNGGKDFLRDCLNHAVWHLFKYLRGDRTENHLSKVAWNCLVVRFFDKKEKQSQSELS
jgi:hypothetical protein